MRVCDRHGKKCYPTQRAAISAALRYSRKRGVALRVYPQAGCGFHLTSKRKWEAVA